METNNNYGPEDLLDMGFKIVGDWTLANGILKSRSLADPSLSALWKATNVLYAFASDHRVYYIGKTTRKLGKRMYEYERGDPSLKTNKKCHRKIKELLSTEPSSPLHIWLFAPTDTLLFWGDFRINIAAGLEDSLIIAFAPPWNGNDRGQLQTESSVVEETVSSNKSDASTLRAQQPTNDQAAFEIPLRGVYWENGYFNPPADKRGLLGKPGTPVALHLEGVVQPLSCEYRRAMAGKDYLRINGGKALAMWIQQHFDRSDKVKVEIVAPDELRLRLKSKS